MVKNLQIEEDLLFSRSIPTGGYTYTLASRLFDALRKAEALYGPRNPEWTICGVEVGPDNHPRIWFPGNERAVIIQITKNCVDQAHRASYQIAHECVHLLDPSGVKHGSVLEEGAAEFFAQSYLLAEHKLDWSKIEKANYLEAFTLVKELLEKHPESIKKLRAAGYKLTGFIAENLHAVEPALAEPLANSLARAFVYQ